MQSTKAARGTLYLTVQQLIQYLAAFIFYAGLARFITQTEVGLWSILTASTAVFTTLTLLGLPVATQKYVSENYGRGDLSLAASISRLSFTIVALSTLPTLTAALLLSSSLSTLIPGGAEYAIPFILILSASAILNFTALYGAGMLGLGMCLEVAVQNLAFILISKASGLALAYRGYGLSAHLVKTLYLPFYSTLVELSEMVEVQVKEVDPQGRISIPIEWRKNWKSRKLVLVRRGDRIEVVPVEPTLPSNLFDSIRISEKVDFADPHSLKRALFELQEH